MNTNPSHLGYDGFIWWMGVVENRYDPLKLGRCQVRIAGAHTANKVSIPTTSLPWAIPMIPLSTSQSLCVKEGDFIVGFYLDGTECQHPVMMGILPGIPDTRTRPTDGFTDARTDFDLFSAPKSPVSTTQSLSGEGTTIKEYQRAERNPQFLNEPTTSRLARNEEIEKTIVQSKKKGVVRGIPKAGGGTFGEPATMYRAKFPFNHVLETEAGHVIEYDDTPGAERIHLYHRSGTFIEMGSTGSMVTKVSNDNYEITMSDKNVFIAGDCNITSNGNMNFKSLKKMTFEAKDIAIKALTGDVKIQAKGDLTLWAQTGKGVFQAAGRMVLSAGAIATLKGLLVLLNPPLASLVLGGAGSAGRSGKGTAKIQNFELGLEAQQSEMLKQVIEDSQQKLTAMEGEQAYIDGGASPDDVKDLKSPLSTPLVNTLPTDIIGRPSETDSARTSSLETPVTACEGVTAPPISYELVLTPRFKLKDLTIDALYKNFIPDEGWKKHTAAELICNLKALATHILEPLCTQYPGFRINSAFRPEAGESQHAYGEAVDLQWPGKNIDELYLIAKWMKETLPFDQLIFEYGVSAWIHVSFRRPENGGNRSNTVPNKICSYLEGGWPHPIRSGGKYAEGLILLADRRHLTTAGGGSTFA